MLFKSERSMEETEQQIVPVADSIIVLWSYSLRVVYIVMVPTLIDHCSFLWATQTMQYLSCICDDLDPRQSAATASISKDHLC